MQTLPSFPVRCEAWTGAGEDVNTDTSWSWSASPSASNDTLITALYSCCLMKGWNKIAHTDKLLFLGSSLCGFYYFFSHYFAPDHDSIAAYFYCLKTRCKPTTTVNVRSVSLLGSGLYNIVLLSFFRLWSTAHTRILSPPSLTFKKLSLPSLFLLFEALFTPLFRAPPHRHIN